MSFSVNPAVHSAVVGSALALGRPTHRSPSETPSEKQPLTDQRLPASDRSIEVSFDEAAGHPVVTIRSKTTGEIVREIPISDAPRLLVQLSKTTGLIFDRSA